ncbi:MAG: hypothetical protein RRY34_04205 [Victivallaceae bacterium]
MRFFHKRHHNDDGFALISVLIVFSVLGVLVMTILYNTTEIYVKAAKLITISRSHYAAESAVNNAILNLYSDLTVFPERRLGEIDYSSSNTKRFLADNVAHAVEIDEFELFFTIKDANCGIDISGAYPADNIRAILGNSFSDDEKNFLDFTAVMSRITDYTDKNQLVSADGMEAAEYQNINYQTMPRNKKFAYKEEIFLIPGIRNYIDFNEYGICDLLKTIPLNGMRRISGRANLYAAPPALITQICKFTLEERQLLETAMQNWQKHGIQLAKQLSPEMMGKLNSSFSTYESGCYIINTQNSQDGYIKNLQIILKIDSNGSDMNFYEYRYY